MAGSDKDVDAMTKMSNSEAAARGGGISSAQDAADAQYLNAIQTIVGIGRGQRVQADQALGTLANLSGQEASENAQAAAQNAAGLGEAAGIGLGAAGAYGLQPRRAPVQQPQQLQAQPLPNLSPVTTPTTGLQTDYGYSQ